MSTAPPNTTPEIDAESQSGGVISAAIVLVIITSLFVLARLYTRAIILKAVGPEDITIFITQILAIGTSIGTVIQAQNGLGRHTWVVDPDASLRQLQALYATILIYNPAQIFLKISLLCQFRRLFTGEKTHLICFWMLVFISIWGILQEFLAGMACIPLSLIAPNMAERCINTLPIWYLTSVMNLVTDFVVFSIPIPSVLKLQLRKKQKILLIGLFSLAFFTCIISIVRLFTLRISIETTDPMWDNAGTSYWSVIELNCGIMCGTLPTLRPFLRKIMPSAFSSTGRTGESGHSDGYAVRSKQSQSGGRQESSGIYVQRDLAVSSTTELKDVTPSTSVDGDSMAEDSKSRSNRQDVEAARATT